MKPLDPMRGQLYAEPDHRGIHHGRVRLVGEQFERWLTARYKRMPKGEHAGKGYYQLRIGDPIEALPT